MTRLKVLLWLLMSIMLIASCASSTQVPQGAQATSAPGQTDPPTTEGESGQQASDPPVPTAAPPTPTQEPLAATVNGVKITLADYERQIALYETSMAAAGQDPSTTEGQQALAEARQWILDQMIDQVLIEQAAAQTGITVTDEQVDQTIENLKQEIGEEALAQRVQNEGMTMEEMRSQLRREMIALEMMNHVVNQVPTQAEHIHARHILFNNEEEARQVLAQLQAGADFATLAQTYSKDESTRASGGDLGYFPKGILTSPEVEAVAFQLQPGQFSDVIQSALGYHIIQVLDRQPDMAVTPENLRLLQSTARTQWLETLRAQATIERYIDTP